MLIPYLEVSRGKPAASLFCYGRNVSLLRAFLVSSKEIIKLKFKNLKILIIMFWKVSKNQVIPPGPSKALLWTIVCSLVMA